MALPDSRVLDCFLDDYLNIRQSLWNSTAVSVAKAMSNAVSSFSASFPNLFTHQSQTPDKVKTEHHDDATVRKAICDVLKSGFAQAKTFDDWKKIVYEVGKEGRKAQKRKTVNPDGSLFCQTMNAVRSYIMHELLKDQDKQVIDGYNNEIEALLQKLALKKEEILKTQKRSQSIKKLIVQRNTILYHLSDLHHEESIFTAVELRLFRRFYFPHEEEWHDLTYTRDLTSSPEINFHKPWCYQPRFYLKYHEKNIQPIKIESFEEFLKRALAPRDESEIKNEIKNEVEQKNPPQTDNVTTQGEKKEQEQSTPAIAQPTIVKEETGTSSTLSNNPVSLHGGKNRKQKGYQAQQTEAAGKNALH